MTLPKVAVFGCGPAGLVAAHAARNMGFDVTVLSAERKKSELWGCQYLHQPIPEITPYDRQVTVHYVLDGTAEGYLDKVYGEDYDGTVSPTEMTELHPAWDLRHTYDRLWALWGPHVVPIGPVNGNRANDFIPDFTRNGIVFNTMPRRALCRNPKHSFHSVDVWAMGDSNGQSIPVRPPADNMVLCNGWPDTGWYRTSQVFGYGTVEWSWRDGKKPPFDGVTRVQKPLYTDCTCLPEVHYVGRYGKWQKGYLVHHVYDDVVAKLETVQGRLF